MVLKSNFAVVQKKDVNQLFIILCLSGSKGKSKSKLSIELTSGDVDQEIESFRKIALIMDDVTKFCNS